MKSYTTKSMISLHLLILASLYVQAQTPAKPDLEESVKNTAISSAEKVVTNSFSQFVDWLATLPQQLKNRREKKRIEELNKNRCPDTLECRLDSIAHVLAADARKRNIKILAVWPFSDTVTRQGLKMAEKLSIALSNTGDDIRIVERQRIDAILKELQLNYDGYIDPVTAKELGRMLHADAIVTGSVRIWKNVVHVNIKVIETETGVLLPGKSLDIPMKEEYKPVPAAAQASTTGQIPLPPGFYFLPGVSSEHCAINKIGKGVFRNMTGKEIILVIGYREYLIKAREQAETFWLNEGLQKYRITQPGNSNFVREGEFVIHSCEIIGYDVR